MFLLLVLLFALSNVAWALEGSVPFAPSVEGNFAPIGFVGFYSSPARKPLQGFAFSFFKDLGGENEIDEFAVAAYGEMDFESCRFSFMSTFHSLDSLYRQSYSELDASLSYKIFTFGYAYGFSMEWIPGYTKWARHRNKGGVMANWHDFAIGVAIYGFTDEWVELGGGIHFLPEGRFSVYIEGDSHGVRVGQSVKFEYVKIDMQYGFPNFSVSLMLNFYWSEWFVGGSIASGDLSVLGIFSGKKALK